MRQLRVLEIPPGAMLSRPLQKGWHARGNHAYIIHDTRLNSVLLSTKLSILAQYLNQQCARFPQEHVSVRGLYEAADKRSGYTRGLHKMRYFISKCDLADSHIAFQRKSGQPGIDRAAIIVG